MKGYGEDYGAEALGGSADDGAMGAGGTSPAVGGTGVEVGAEGDTAEKGYQCVAKFPLAGGFFSRKPMNGEA